jgi:octaprenyl-diphosphate synthase
MDFNSQSKKMGKNLGDDFKLGKTTLPIILAWEKSNTSEKKFWDRTLRELKQYTGDFDEALNIFKKYNIFEDCKLKAQEFVSKSKISLEQLPNTQFKEHLIGLASESTQRSK